MQPNFGATAKGYARRRPESRPDADAELAELLEERFQGREIGRHHRVFTLLARAPARR